MTSFVNVHKCGLFSTRHLLLRAENLKNKIASFFRVKEMEMALEDIQEKLWELDKSWKNNLVIFFCKNCLLHKTFNVYFQNSLKLLENMVQIIMFEFD